MDMFLAILAGLLVVLGIVGSLLPVLPGPPLSWLGLLIIHFTAYADFGWTFLLIMAAVMVLVTVLDYLVPLWGSKRFGGTRAGVTGSAVGLVVGLFLGPVGIVLGPFFGALIAELIAGGQEFKEALRSATGAFVGFLLGTGLKLIYGGLAAYYFFRAVW